MGYPRETHSRYVIGCCLISLGICGLKNNSKRITYEIGCVWGMPSLSPLSSLVEIHSNQRDKIYICSVILGQLESFRNYHGCSIILPIILDKRRRENFSDSSFHRIFVSWNLVGKMPKIKLQKIVGNLLDKIMLRKVHEWHGHLEILSLPQGIETSRQFVLLRTDILQKTVLVCLLLTNIFSLP